MGSTGWKRIGIAVVLMIVCSYVHHYVGMIRTPACVHTWYVQGQRSGCRGVNSPQG